MKFLYIMYALLIIYAVGFILEMLFKKRNNRFDTYFGVPGSGKTTFAAYLTKKALKKKKNVFSNVSLKGAYAISKEDIGKYDMSNGLILCDEAGVEFNNRNYAKNFADYQIDFLKHHRHYNDDLCFFSQYWNDIDVTLRRLSTRLFLLKPCFIPFCVKRKKIGKRIGIDKETKQIIDEYYFVPFFFFGTKYIFSPPLWKMFNTHEKKPLISKQFKKYA